MKIYQIAPRIYQSGKFPDDWNLLQKKVVLRENKIAAVVNLWHKKDPDVEVCVSNYRHIYLPDGKFSEEKWRAVFELLPALVVKWQMGENLLAMCYGGRNRSGLFNALLLREIYGISGEAAMCIVREKRPNSLVNPDFVAYLKTLPERKGELDAALGDYWRTSDR